MTEDQKLVKHHRDEMISNLRMASDAAVMMAFPSEERFLSRAAQHAAIATELRSMIAEETVS